MDEHQRNSFSVLFVCTGNLCRSPMAETLFKHFLEKKYPPADVLNWQVASAGTLAARGEPATLGAQLAMSRRELTLINHRSKQVTRKLLAKFKLVLVMESGHKEALQVEFPLYARKIYLLSEMAGKQGDIEDPIGGSLADYAMTANEIDGLIEGGFEKIFQLAK